MIEKSCDKAQLLPVAEAWKPLSLSPSLLKAEAFSEIQQAS
jgi:hypothetical protein